MAQANINHVIAAVNAACRSRGGKYSEYSCKTVSWDDAKRGNVDGQLSQWGPNITDTRLYEKNGQLLYTVRSDNWNEKLGRVSADKVGVVLANYIDESHVTIKRISLKELLENIGEHGRYAGLNYGCNLSNAILDQHVSVRFQTTFLPVNDKQDATLEFAPEAYNHNTRSDDDPKNLLLLCTTQGVAVQQDGAGAKKLFLHSIDRNGIIHRHWLEAQRTAHKVGGAQTETAKERNNALAKGKAVSTKIGLESMGSRFNVLMTIQVPLMQTKKYEPNSDDDQLFYDDPGCYDSDDSDVQCDAMEFEPKPKVGQSNAARVSKGSEVDTWGGLSISDPERHPNEHITVTVVLYNTVAGGVPSEKDVVAAIDDMEHLYASCEWTGKLADDGAGVFKGELTVGDMEKIATKHMEQPYQKNEGKVENLIGRVFGVFTNASK